MKIRRLAVAALAAVLFLSARGSAFSDEVVMPPQDNGGAPKSEEPFIYTIVPHDTLWDISEKFLKNPFKWPKIWKLNPYIKNPDLIYPGNVVKILPDGTIVIGKKVDLEKLPVVPVEPGAERTVVLEPAAGAVAPAPKAPVPTMASDAIERTGFISREELELSGAIMESKEDRLYSSEGDRIYVSFKNAEDVKTGDRFTVFRVGPAIKHPVTKRDLGYTYDILGHLTVTEKGSVVEARIDDSYKEIETGDKLRPYVEPVREVEITESGSEASGYIVASLEGRENLGAGDIAYIDLGSSSGVKEGNVMRIFRRDKKVTDPMNGKTVELPPVELGTLVVVKAGEKTSSCVVVDSLKTIVRGDSVSTLRKPE